MPSTRKRPAREVSAPSEPKRVVPLHVVLAILPMPSNMREEFEVTAKVLRSDYVVHPSPVVIGQYMAHGQIALSLNVRIVPKASLHEHYARHSKCKRCNGLGEISDKAEELAGIVLCPAEVSEPSHSDEQNPTMSRKRAKCIQAHQKRQT